MKNNIKLLDCTLRDGGLALNQNDSGIVAQFTKEQMIDIVANLECSGVDIIELGMVQHLSKNKEKFAIYSGIKELSQLIPSSPKAIYAAFFHGPDIPMNEIPQYDPSLCNLIRMSVRYSELEKSLEYCQKLTEKGYKVSIQPTVTMQYTEQEVDSIINAANQMQAYAVYIVDSYGCMSEDNINQLYKVMDEKLNATIRIGFHAHNNMNFAVANVIDILKQCGQRKIIIDSCCTGMGQGAGNLETEIIVCYLNQLYNKEYDFFSILKVCDLLKEFWPKSFWGYSPVTAISAAYKMAYKYAVVLREEYQLSLYEIASILQWTPEELKYRYTQENLEQIIEIYKQKGGIIQV